MPEVPPFFLPWQLYWFLQYLHSDLGFLGSKLANLMKCCHTIDVSLPPCLGDSGGSDAAKPIGVAGSSGLGSRGGGLGSLGAPNPGGALTSI